MGKDKTVVSDSENFSSPSESEDEPSTVYDVRWRTLMAIFALSMSNVCAAISNTVRHLPLAMASLSTDHMANRRFQTNTIIQFQIQDLGNAGLQSWIANSNLLVTLAFGPVLVSSRISHLHKTSSIATPHSIMLTCRISPGILERPVRKEVVHRHGRLDRRRRFRRVWLRQADNHHHRGQCPHRDCQRRLRTSRHPYPPQIQKKPS